MRWLHTLAQCVAVAVAFWAPAAAFADVKPADAQAATAGVVNITNASAEELQRLPGIGEKKAQAIIDHRKGHPMHKVEDLTKVKGIGRKTVARLRPFLTVNGPTTLHDRPVLRRKTEKL